jgi:acetylornithine deacetylase/succinyl-diaminopimelate desuccinylase-like protein
VLIYARVDKRPETVESFEGRDPVEPKMDGDWLYGKGCADAGYGAFAALLAIKSL